MSDSDHKSGLHIHIGGLIIFIILILILFKVDIKSVVKSPQFQENVSYLKEQSLNIWDKYLAKPIKDGWNSLFNTLIDKGAQQLKNSLNSSDNNKQINSQDITNSYRNLINIKEK